MSLRTKSKDLEPGTRLRHKLGDVVVLDRRKKSDDSEFNLPGWWLTDGVGGLADIVIDDAASDWTVLAPLVREDNINGRDEERIVCENAVVWWESHRPVGWTQKQHAAEPAVNTSSSLAAALAVSVADLVEPARSLRGASK